MSFDLKAESAMSQPGPAQAVRAMAEAVKSYSATLTGLLVTPAGAPTDSLLELTHDKQLELAKAMLDMSHVVQKFLDTSVEANGWASPSTFRQQSMAVATNAGGPLASFSKDFLAPIGNLSYISDPAKLLNLMNALGGTPAAKGVAILKSVPVLKHLVAALSLLPQVEDAVAFARTKNDATVRAFSAAVGRLSSLLGESASSMTKIEKRAASQADKLLKGHPEAVCNVLNAAGYFSYAITPVVEQPSPSNSDNGDSTLSSQYDLTGEDIIGLAAYAASNIDPRVAMGQGSAGGAIMDAVLRAVAEKDEGKYAGKVSSSTMDIILAHTAKLVGGKKPVKPENQNSRYTNLAARGADVDPLESMPSAQIAPYSEPVAKTAAKKEPEKPTEQKSVLDTLMGLGADTAGKSEAAAKAQVRKTVQKVPTAIRSKLSQQLDAVASSLEGKDLAPLAEKLDLVSNTLEASEDDSY